MDDNYLDDTPTLLRRLSDSQAPGYMPPLNLIKEKAKSQYISARHAGDNMAQMRKTTDLVLN